MTEEQRDEILLTILKNSTETKEKVEKLEKRMDALEKRIEELEKRVETLERRMKTLEQKVEELKKELEEIKVKLKNIQIQVTNINSYLTVIEVEHGEKLDIIFNAISMHTDKFNMQDERILRNERKIEKYADKLYLLEQKVNK